MAPQTKLTVLIRVEPGSLGPDGMDHVEGYCQVASKCFEKLHSSLIEWKIVPRYDKALPEIEYLLNNKKLSVEQTNKMLKLINKDDEQLETDVMSHISNLIDKYLGHQY